MKIKIKLCFDVDVPSSYDIAGHSILDSAEAVVRACWNSARDVDATIMPGARMSITRKQISGATVKKDGKR